MALREYYAPAKAIDSASQLGTTLSDKQPTTILKEYYGPASSHITTGFHGAPFDTGIEPGSFNDLYGHSGPVVSIAFSPNGAHVAAGSKDGELRIWSIDTPALRRDLIGHTDMIAAVAYSLNGKLLVSGSADKTIRVWNTAYGQNRSVLTGHTSTVTAVSFALDGGHIVSGSEDRTVRIWNLSTGSCRIISGQKPQLAAVAFSRIGGLAALSSCGDHPTLKLLNLIEPEWRFLSNLGAVAHAIAFSPNGQTLAAGLADNTVQFWDVAKDESCILLGHQAPVFAITCSVDEKLVVSGSADGTVRIWHKASIQNHLVIACEAKVWAVSYSPDGKLMAVGLGNGKVRIFGVKPSKPMPMAKRMTASMRKLFT